MQTVLIAINLILSTVILIYLYRTGHRDKDSLLGAKVALFERMLDNINQNLHHEFTLLRGELNHMAKQDREELAMALSNIQDSVLTRMVEISNLQKNQLDMFSLQLTSMAGTSENKWEIIRDTLEKNMVAVIESADQNARFNREELGKSLKEFTNATQQKLEDVRITVERRLQSLQEDNNQKLEQMRATVDDKLHSTLEQRLGDSFKIVSERLELVHKGLGEMQTLASGVGDLKKVLTNVKTRGIWGEIQLGNILDQILSQEQYLTNVVTKKGSRERVEYAIRLPGRGTGDNEVLLPIDAKFPQEDFLRIIEGTEQCNQLMVEEAGKQLENRIRLEAKAIRDKYIDPPATTDFAILFLPTEGLYAEVVKRPGLVFSLQSDYRVIIAGPTTMAALLNSLSIGFRTLAIEKRSGEVWNLLAIVKNEFGKFAHLLDKTRKKLEEATTSIDTASRKTKTIERKLRQVQSLPEGQIGKMAKIQEIAADNEES
ncbi:MAG: DNA recombination protein RmuC [Syntrophomonadaceae bacterium]|jgi:DNA recombination protein RmuC